MKYLNLAPPQPPKIANPKIRADMCNMHENNPKIRVDMHENNTPHHK